MKLAKAYNPQEFENDIYQLWEQSGAFKPSGKGEPYSIVMPPPNANGNLHIGHALMANLEDVLVRYHRMQGKDALYLPGADHAGFETWVVFERQLQAQGKSRVDFERTELYQQVWDFVAGQRGNMETQLRALGASADWSNLTFTLDDKVVKTVYSTFKKMWDEGLIYRGERIVNYSTAYQTSYADIEVNYKMEKGKLWQIAYPVVDQRGEIVVATTRPETLLGDTAIAVHPTDKRYGKLVGKKVLVPLTGREIPIVADEHVDPEYGTGAVKVTPAHDPNDFEIGLRHDLPRIQVIDYDGRMINVPKEFEGMDVDKARKAVLESLKVEEYLRGEEDIEHSVGYDYKSGLPIQPLVKDQWFISVKPLAARAIKAVKKGEVNIIPASRKKALLQYYENLRDWNISRQIPWGIPIPAFQNVDDPSDWIFDDRVDQETIVVNNTTYKREEDTFDTWFSSGQWPFITTDALENGELSRFYPNSVLETGFDILYQWVARMIMLGLYATGQVPFKDVYLHGLVLDEHGQKMSKSKGNVVNPMDIVQEYGSDALRLGIIGSRGAAQNQAFSKGKVTAGRNFANKLWNIARFIEGTLDDNFKPSEPKVESLADHWIVRQLNRAAADVAEQLENYRFAEASETVYHAIWDDVADWYVESAKKAPNPDLMAWVLQTSLKIAHPFAPFVTETIWQTLDWSDELLISSAWPTELECSDIAAGEYEQLQALVMEARYVTAELPGNKKYGLLYRADSLIADNAELIQWLARLAGVEEITETRGLRLAAGNREAWLDVDSETLYEHQTNLEKRLSDTRDAEINLRRRLENPKYVNQAPEHLVEETRQQLAEKQELIKKLQEELEVLN
ncbi:valine--tRNA ligase [Candidatus Saccharibacteria bacterium]|nr:valine--tRNA ligase [Candidatus Saccharibacteria bacterium]